MKQRVRVGHKGGEQKPAADFIGKHSGSGAHQKSHRMGLGRDFRMVRLCESNVAPAKRRAREPRYESGERLFQGLMKLLRKNFPASEIESEKQYRDYFYDKNKDSWFVQAAVDNSGEVIAAALYSIKPEAKIVMFNIIVTGEALRLKAVAAELIADMLAKPEEYTGGRQITDFQYVMAEIERPDPSLRGRMAELVNRIRPAFHDSENGSKVRAIRLPNGEPLVYLLPIMASDEERKEAKAKGKPFEPEPLLFCLRSLVSDERSGISAKEAGRLLVWFYKDYLEGECADVKPKEVNALLAQTLASLTSDPEGRKQREFEALLSMEADTRGQILSLIPGTTLSFMKINETWPKSA